MRAGKLAPPALDFPEHAADHGAERFLDDLVIRDQAIGRVFCHHCPES
jgi:hypothetical protein